MIDCTHVFIQAWNYVVLRGEQFKQSFNSHIISQSLNFLFAFNSIRPCFLFTLCIPFMHFLFLRCLRFLYVHLLVFLDWTRMHRAFLAVWRAFVIPIFRQAHQFVSFVLASVCSVWWRCKSMRKQHFCVISTSGTILKTW